MPLTNGAPSHDVFGNVLLALRPDALLGILEPWVGELSGKHFAIDGKVSRGAKDTTTGKSTLHILRAWASEAGLSVDQEVCEEKGNELSAKVLKSSPLKGSIRSLRKHCALDPSLRTEAARLIFHGFGA